MQRVHRVRSRILMWPAMFILGLLSSPKDIGAESNGPIPPVPEVKPIVIETVRETAAFALPVSLRLPTKKPTLSNNKIIKAATEKTKEEIHVDAFAPRPTKKPGTSYKSSGRVPKNGVLSDKDALLYKSIFALQKDGHWKEADDLFRKIENKSLRGHVLFQRYMHPTKYSSTYKELSSWLALYADYPGADKVYKLAEKKKPSGFKGKTPKAKAIRHYKGSLEYQLVRAKPYKSRLKRNAVQRAAVSRLERAINKNLARKKPSQAFSRLRNDETTRWLDRTEYDILQADIAKSFMHAGRSDKALQLAVDSLRHSPRTAPVAGWVAGLISWRWNEYSFSASYFEKAADSPYASAWMASSASYWAYRAYDKLGNVHKARYWLGRAALYPRTFYGLLAIETLGDDTPFNWNVPSLTKEYETTLKKTVAGKRAIALVQSGQHHLAGEELFRLDPGKNKSLKKALLAFAIHKNVPAYAYRFGNSYKDETGQLYDSALYPLGNLKLTEGPHIDKALIHAIIRQESHFNPEAGSNSGATGLMQIMPATAAYVSGDKSLNTPAGRHRLKDPEINVKIGKQYIADLLADENVDNDLLLLAAAYNAGPGNLRKWKTGLPKTEDPLLFIEMIPVSETRGYIQRVMRNLWVYRARLGQDAPSMRALVTGHSAKYASLDYEEKPIRLAELQLR